MDSATTFNQLMLGLEELLNSDCQYPYPDVFQRSCNVLALYMGSSYPRTLTGMLKLLNQPLKSWYPLELPQNFDAECSLIHEGALSQEAQRYLELR